MIATVSPGASSADHTINTLRYADRIKEKKVRILLYYAIYIKFIFNMNLHFEIVRWLIVCMKVSDVKMRKSKSVPKIEESKLNGRSRVNKEPVDDLDILHTSLRGESPDDLFESDEEKSVEEIAQLHRTVQTLFEEEESLLNLHMSVIQENAELLTEEGKLLQGVQSDAVVDYDIDNYASQLGSILDRKSYLINQLKEKLSSFRTQLQREEELSKKVVSLPGY